MTNRALGVEVPPDKRGMVGYGSFAAVMDALETAVAGRLIAGDRFSPRTSMSARRSAGACSSARSRRAPRSRLLEPAQGPPRQGPRRRARRRRDGGGGLTRPVTLASPAERCRPIAMRSAGLVAGQRGARRRRGRSSWPLPPMRRPSSPASMIARGGATDRASRRHKVARLPGFRRWIWDGDLPAASGCAGSLALDALPAHVLGHVGYSVVPWRRRRGLAPGRSRRCCRAHGRRALNMSSWWPILTTGRRSG